MTNKNAEKTEQSATHEEIKEWDEENDEPHPIFGVPHRPERQSLKFDEDKEDNEE